MPKYIVANETGNFITKEGRDYPQLFTRYDLLKVSAGQRNIISQKNANTLNRLNNPEDIVIQGDLPAEVPQAAAQAILVARAERVTKPVLADMLYWASSSNVGTISITSYAMSWKKGIM